MKPKLGKNETLVIAWADKCAGPGWSNTPIWYIVRTNIGQLEQRCLQPDEQSKDIRILFGVNYESSASMAEIVNDWLTKK